MTQRSPAPSSCVVGYARCDSRGRGDGHPGGVSFASTPTRQATGSAPHRGEAQRRLRGGMEQRQRARTRRARAATPVRQAGGVRVASSIATAIRSARTSSSTSTRRASSTARGSQSPPTGSSSWSSDGIQGTAEAEGATDPGRRLRPPVRPRRNAARRGFPGQHLHHELPGPGASVATTGSGDFVVVWQAFLSATRLLRTAAGKVSSGRQFAASGTPSGGSSRSTRTRRETRAIPPWPRRANGDFTVVWQSQDGSSLGSSAGASTPTAHPGAGISGSTATPLAPSLPRSALTGTGTSSWPGRPPPPARTAAQRRLRPALQQARSSQGGRVPDQQLHSGSPGRLVRRTKLPTGTSWWPGRGNPFVPGRTGAPPASSASGSTRPAAGEDPSSR